MAAHSKDGARKFQITDDQICQEIYGDPGSFYNKIIDL
jgi:hypothetical protein